MSGVRLTVIVPTYRRVDSLKRCLAALALLQRPADEVVVTVRDTDTETQKYLAGTLPPSLPVRSVPVREPGVVAAMNAGLAAATGDIIALTDDDTAPHKDWLERIEALFASDPKIGGVGGRDWVYFGERLDGAGYESENVGRLLWFGLIVGNHHVGIGGPRDVELLKGANCAYRAAALKLVGFDSRLRGQGAQVHWELMLGLNLLRRGWRLVYDPAIGVDHFPSVRHGKDQRGQFQTDTHYDIIYNETISLSEYLPPLRRAAFLLWATLVGTRFAPGLLQFFRLILLGKGEARQDAPARFRCTWSARWAGNAAASRTASKFPPIPQTAAVRGIEEVGA